VGYNTCELWIGKNTSCACTYQVKHKSNRAIKNLQDYCREHMGENYSIEVIDLKEHPQLAEGEQIIATPALVKKLPEPMRVWLGT